jgi:hypothetical protein
MASWFPESAPMPKRFHGIELGLELHFNSLHVWFSFFFSSFFFFSFSFFLIRSVILGHLNTMDVGFDMYQTQ